MALTVPSFDWGGGTTRTLAYQQEKRGPAMVPRDVARFVRFACFAAAVALSASRLPPGAPEAPPVLDLGGHGAKPLPPPLQDFVTRVARLTDEQRRNLDEGKPVSRLLDADPSTEVAIFGAVWIASSMQRYVRAIADIENFEKGGIVRLTRRISTPPRLEDFAELRVPHEDLAALPRCRVGDCDLKLGEPALGRLQTEVDWKAPDAVDRANLLVRNLALEYVTGYLEGGNERLAVYRDRERPTFVAKEFTRMIDQMPELTAYAPDLRPYLLEYPRVALPGATSFLYLARDGVRSEADHSHQPFDHPPGKRRHGRRGVQDALCQPLLLDGPRTAGARARPRARTRLLVRHGQPQSVRRPWGSQGRAPARHRAPECPRRNARCPPGDQMEARAV